MFSSNFTHDDLAVLENPIDYVAHIAQTNQWQFVQHAEDEASLQLQGRWQNPYDIAFLWQDDVQALQTTCTFALAVPPKKLLKLQELLVAINHKTWLGHFALEEASAAPDVTGDDAVRVVYRYTSLMRGLHSNPQAHMEEVIDSMVSEADRFYPAIHMLLNAKGAVANDLLATALFDHAGEA